MTLLYIWLCGIPVAMGWLDGMWALGPKWVMAAVLWPVVVPMLALYSLGIWLGDKCKERKP